jgi:urease gamma subunit
MSRVRFPASELLFLQRRPLKFITCWTGVSRLEFGMKLNYTEAANYIRYFLHEKAEWNMKR